MSNFEHLHSVTYFTELNKRHYSGVEVLEHVAEIRHNGLSTSTVIKYPEKSLVESLVVDQFIQWDEQWEKILLINNYTSDQFNAKGRLLRLENILNEAIKRDNSFDIETLYQDKVFDIENPKKRLQNELDQFIIPDKPKLNILPIEPDKIQFGEKFTFLDNLIKSKKEKKIELQEALYNNSLIQWKKEFKECEQKNLILLDKYNEEVNIINVKKEKLISEFDILESKWILDKKNFYVQQDLDNETITNLKKSYFNKEAIAIVKYCECVLNSSSYPENFPKSFEIEFKADEKILVLDYVLPCIEDLPNVAEVKFIAARKELKQILLSETQLLKNYDSTIYKIVLRTLYELFQSDNANAIQLIALNGWVNAINKGTGQRINNCIVSIQVGKDEFNSIDLANVDPKTCFKNLKGISSSKLNSLTAIKPIIQIKRDDKRFVSSYDVTDSIDETSNLAIMSWEDFEHLIREIFEKEFSYNGGEVKVTQASRDGGVDAIAFDPDPIRGGKIIIQAKRYTNTVGVSAVRDLYGTVMNEGATKGILVTTTDYGPDAYEFVKNKPLTLMNGSNLLYLLEKHGHRARIDIAEAKFLMAKNNQL